MKRWIHASTESENSLRKELFEDLYKNDGAFSSKYEMQKALDIDWTDVTAEDSAEFFKGGWFNPKAIRKVEYMTPLQLEAVGYPAGYKVTSSRGVEYYGFREGSRFPNELDPERVESASQRYSRQDVNASVNDMLPIDNPEWVLDKADDGTHYDLIDPAYGWATIGVYNSYDDKKDRMNTIYRATVQPNKKVKMGRAFYSFEEASEWAEKQLYQKYAPIED